MTVEQRLTLVAEMEQLLQMSKEETENGNLSSAERKDIKVFAMERTLKILGYEVEIDTENYKVNIK